MSQPITITSPISKTRVKIGHIDIRSREATFWINQSRFFREAECIGIDQNVFNRKGMEWCRKITFQLWDGRVFRISKTDFERESWLYPKRQSEEYKAHKPDFQPKYMISLEVAAKLNKLNKEAEELEFLKTLSLKGQKE